MPGYRSYLYVMQHVVVGVCVYGHVTEYHRESKFKCDTKYMHSIVVMPLAAQFGIDSLGISEPRVDLGC